MSSYIILWTINTQYCKIENYYTQYLKTMQCCTYSGCGLKTMQCCIYSGCGLKTVQCCIYSGCGLKTMQCCIYSGCGLKTMQCCIYSGCGLKTVQCCIYSGCGLKTMQCCIYSGCGSGWGRVLTRDKLLYLLTCCVVCLFCFYIIIINFVVYRFCVKRVIRFSYLILFVFLGNYYCLICIFVVVIVVYNSHCFCIIFLL